MDIPNPATPATSTEDINQLFEGWLTHIRQSLLDGDTDDPSVRTHHIIERENTNFNEELWSPTEAAIVVKALYHMGFLPEIAKMIVEFLDRSKWRNVTGMLLFSVPLRSIVDIHRRGRIGGYQLRREFVFFGRTDGGSFELEVQREKYLYQSNDNLSGHFPLPYYSETPTLQHTTIYIRGSLDHRYLVGWLPQPHKFPFPNLKEKTFTWSREHGSKIYEQTSDIPKGRYALFRITSESLRCMDEVYLQELHKNDVTTK